MTECYEPFSLKCVILSESSLGVLLKVRFNRNSMFSWKVWTGNTSFFFNLGFNSFIRVREFKLPKLVNQIFCKYSDIHSSCNNSFFVNSFLFLLEIQLLLKFEFLQPRLFYRPLQEVDTPTEGFDDAQTTDGNLLHSMKCDRNVIITCKQYSNIFHSNLIIHCFSISIIKSTENNPLMKRK